MKIKKNKALNESVESIKTSVAEKGNKADITEQASCKNTEEATQADVVEACAKKPVNETCAKNQVEEACTEVQVEEACEKKPVDEALDLNDPNDVAALSKIAQAILNGAKTDAKAPEIDKAFGADVDAKTGTVSDEIAEEAEELADATIEIAKIIDVPRGAISTSLADAEYNLERALRTAVQNAEAGYDADYPNVILSGLAGFGKTSLVKSWCKKHGLNMFECDAKSLDIATVGGIPYPEKGKDGRLMQTPIASRYWDGLFKPNTVLFLDEYNRANPSVAGTLLGLINNHDLPMTTQKKDGNFDNVHHFGNILFTVIAINPAASYFSDVQEFTPEKVSRCINIVNIEPNKATFKKHVLDVYDKALSIIALPDSVRRAYEGQRNLAEAILSNKEFAFNTAEEVGYIHDYNNNSGKIKNFLNYRTFMMSLLDCDGTKLDYLSGLAKSYNF